MVMVLFAIIKKPLQDYLKPVLMRDLSPAGEIIMILLESR
jgi:hypothetical protein